MQESPDARAALLRFYDAFTSASPGDEALFDRVFAASDDLLVVGTAFHEWVEDRSQGQRAWGSEGVGIEPGDPVAWESGDVAWAVDRPAFVAGDRRVPIRLTAVMVREDGDWKIQHGHFSIGVPDEIGFASAEAWSEVTPPPH
jgi:hypothetical protein